MLNLSKYGFVVARAPSGEVDPVLHAFMSRKLSINVSRTDDSVVVSVEHPFNNLSVEVEDDGITVCTRNDSEQLGIWQNTPMALNVCAELIAKSSKWAQVIRVGKVKLHRGSVFHYHGSGIGFGGRFEVDAGVTGGDSGHVMEFYASVWDNQKSERIVRVGHAANDPSKVLDAIGLKSLIQDALIESEIPWT
jgi:hypothetical protein